MSLGPRTLFLALFGSALFVVESAAAPLRGVGAHSMSGLMSCWIETFEPITGATQVVFEPGPPGQSAAGVTALAERRAEFGAMAREFFPTEEAALIKTLGRIPTPVKVALGSFDQPGKTHAIAIYVNDRNPLQHIDMAQLRDVLVTGGARAWGDLGLTGPWAERAVHVYGMPNVRTTGNPPGIVNFLQRRIEARLSDSIEQLSSTRQEHALEAIVRRIAEDPLAIGYSGFGFGRDGARALAVSEGGNGIFVPGNADTVSAGAYPLTRFIYMVISPRVTPEQGAALGRFGRHILSPEGQACVRSDNAGFLPLPASMRQEAVSLMEQLAPAPPPDEE